MKYNSEIIITGEKIQQFANIYLGNHADFKYNPLIAKDIKKHVCMNDIYNTYDNGYTIIYIL